jgi:hypothetical protein
MCVLMVLGGKDTRPERVATILAIHREHGRYWSSRPYRFPRAGDGVVAKVAGVSELWMTGVVKDGKARHEPHPGVPDRWAWAYLVDWDPPARTGLPVRDVLGPNAVHAHQMVRLSRDDFDTARRALYG